MSEGTGEAKARTRARLRALRKALAPEDVRLRGARLQARVLASPAFQAARTIALYAALPGEVPTEALLEAALAQHKRVVFPVVPAAGRELVFRSIEEAAQLAHAGRLSIREPEDTRPSMALGAIELFVVPGLAFTRQCQRLGQGAGYYDATLARASADTARLGLAFSEFVLESLPVEASDVAMHFVVTEEATFTAPGAAATVLGARSAPT